MAQISKIIRKYFYSNDLFLTNERSSIIKMGSYFVLTVIIFNLLSIKYSIGFNTTDSLKGYVFLIIKSEIPRVGELAAFKTPFRKQFIKKVVARKGDQISWKGRTFQINGVDYGTAKTLSKKGDPLVKGYEGIISRNLFFMYSPHKDSYDSRYKDIGLISEKNIIGVAYKII